MATKPASAVQQFSPESIEAKAYASVSAIPTVEPNDRNRLGYHVYRWLTQKQGTLEQAISASGSRLQISKQQAAEMISGELKKSGLM
ncbi:MAG: hypothetical protein HY960_10235 [Ignavibacteriae bacterium]|nr:hypothetical protein [Ignavibacteriota bacterium]